MASKITQIDNVLRRYYESCSQPYDALFANYCEDNGIESDDLEDQFDEAADDCMLVEFDEEFPLKEQITANQRTEFIYDILNKARKVPNMQFRVPMPLLHKEWFQIEDQDMKTVKQIYASQCPACWNSGMANDSSMLKVLAIGHKYKFDYLQHLVDDYLRARVKHGDEGSLSVNEWTQGQKHFKNLKNLTKLNTIQPYHLVTGAIKAFSLRFIPKLLYQPLIKINSSLPITVKYISSTIKFITSILSQKQVHSCPFQVDLCIAVGKPMFAETDTDSKNVDEDIDIDDDDDDDDDDDKEEAVMYIDCIGDIKAKLSKNKLSFERSSTTHDVNIHRKLLDLCTILWKKHKDKEKLGNEFHEIYRKRLVLFVDRRGSEAESDDIYAYYPPTNCANVPKDAVSEWYLSSSKTCLLPNMEYGDGKSAELGIRYGDIFESLVKGNINSGSHCKGGLLTFSFHVMEQDRIRVYLYWNGEMTRFMPEDIKIVLPRLFYMNGALGNDVYVKDEKQIDQVIQEMNQGIDDVYFKAFRQNYFMI